MSIKKHIPNTITCCNLVSGCIATIVFSQLFVMEYPGFLEPLRPWLPYAAFIIAAFSALRLAKFNLDERQTTSFIGVPTPANALFWGSLIVFNPSWLEGY